MSKIACHPVCPSSSPWCWVQTSGSGLAAGWDQQYLQCLWAGRAMEHTAAPLFPEERGSVGAPGQEIQGQTLGGRMI